MRNLKKLLPGARREPKILVVFSNTRLDCDRLIRYLTGDAARFPYPIHVYCLEEPQEAQHCARLVVDCDSRRLYQRARRELADVWVALSVTSWNHDPNGALMKLIPLTLPPFRGIVGNENGDFFDLRPLPVMRHLVDRAKQRFLPGCLAWLGTYIRPLAYYMFDKRPAGKAGWIDRPSASPGDLGVTRVEHFNRWDCDRIRTTLEECQSRFVLFCPPDFDDTIDEFLPLFDDPLTFAVSRQSGFREWRRTLVIESPFRPLSPGEVSRVTAPLGQVILVDRRKLLKLTLPGTSLFGAAWLNIFWRAAGAGWRSYTVGGRTALPDQDDFWQEEALLVRQLYRDAGLRRLAACESQLSRGNIACRPDLTRPYRGLPRILVVAPYLPFPMSHGGAVRIYNLCKALAGQVDFIYVGFREVTDVVDYQELHKIFRQVYVVDRDEISKSEGLPKQVNHFESSSMRALISSVAREQAVDLLQIEYTDMAAYREAAPHVPAILVEHDLTYTLYRQLKEYDDSPAMRLEYERWLRFETGRLRTFDGVFVMSTQDRDEAVRVGSNRRRTYVIPNGVDLEKFCALPPAPQTAPEIFYVGSFRHLPNFLGFEELRTRIMPLVWDRYPDATLRVVAGPDHETHWRNALQGAAIPRLDPRIILHGFVADLLPLYQTAHIVAAPLPLSAGTNIKVMEAMACRRVVAGTPAGVQGLGLRNDFDAVICQASEDLAVAICRLICNPALRDAIAARGRATAEARFGWKSIARHAFEAYSEMTSTAPTADESLAEHSLVRSRGIRREQH